MQGLSEEEKKAIKYFYNLRATIDESNMLFDEDINVKCGKETIKQITTILNIIETQQKEIEFKEDIIKQKKKEYNQTKKALKGQIAKKDRIIDLMATHIGEIDTTEDMCIEDIEEVDCDLIDRKCKDCVKEYFEKKIEGE